jgi:hypothetical protein
MSENFVEQVETLTTSSRLPTAALQVTTGAISKNMEENIVFDRRNEL